MAEKVVELFIKDLQRHRSAKASADKNISLFQGVSDNSLQALLSNSHIKNFPAGQEITQQGDDPDFLYFIIEGNIKTFRYSAEGGEATIRMLRAGETLMDAAIFMGGKSPVGAKALNDSRLLMIPAETVRRHTLLDPLFSCNLLKIVTRHYKTALQQIDSIITKTPLERIGYYFLKQHIEQGHDSMDISLPFQKSTIASHLGMTPETFSRALSQLKKMGMSVDQDRLTLRDAYALCHYCDSDTAHICPKFRTDKCPGSFNGCGQSRH